MLTRQSPDRFLVDFARVKRRRGWKSMLAARGPVVVDGYAVGQAVSGTLSACPFRNAAGAPQVWNEYRVFLARADHDRLRPVEPALQAELGPMLYQEILRLGATTIGELTVRLLIDDADEVEEGTAMIHARHAPDAATTPGVQGEMTIRLDKLKAPPAATSTTRVGGAVLEAGSQVVPLSDGVRYVLGRPHPDAESDHLALTGASTRINRRQVGLEVAEGRVLVTREPGDSNPVVVNGRALTPGAFVEEALPVDIVLSGGAMKVRVRGG